ncbi:inositol-tetrakisphosphate 1-kinase-like [Centruroides vittatus]|uniref:inositol-tetrakisphosphate 1-kinase-like n=1 Tax=Centruroides vittatus TaxID=120091 RepID=UPI0035104B56
MEPIRRIGYWWSEKKSRKFNMPEFTRIFRSAGLKLIKIDLEKPLEDQGPFTAIIHKLSDVTVRADRGDEAAKQAYSAFKKYIGQHRNIIMIDPLQNVEKLLYRYCQYKLIEECELGKADGVFTPAFAELTSTDIQENIKKLKAAGVEYPFVCKPSLAHGLSYAHQMSIIFGEHGLKDITPPCVAQTFIIHNAILYKLFVIGSNYFVIERPSLKNFTAGNYPTIHFNSHDISKPHSASSLTELDSVDEDCPIIKPDKECLDRIVDIARQKIGLNLLGIDVIVDNRTGRYAIIDMNAFPGYDGVDNFLDLLCDLTLTEIRRLQPSNKEINGIIEHTNHSFSSGTYKGYQLSISPVDHSTETKLYDVNEIAYGISPTAHNLMYQLEQTGHMSLPLADYPNIFDTSIVPENIKWNQSIDPTINSLSVEKLLTPIDSSQEDSGIDTSDSCDEKKNKVVPPRITKRQHSRGHATITASPTSKES